MRAYTNKYGFMWFLQWRWQEVRSFYISDEEDDAFHEETGDHKNCTYCSNSPRRHVEQLRCGSIHSFFHSHCHSSTSGRINAEEQEGEDVCQSSRTSSLQKRKKEQKHCVLWCNQENVPLGEEEETMKSSFLSSSPSLRAVYYIWRNAMKASIIF